MCGVRRTQRSESSDSLGLLAGNAQTAVVPSTPKGSRDPTTINQRPASSHQTPRPRQRRTSKANGSEPPSACSPSQQTVARRETGKVAQSKPLQGQFAPTARPSTGPPPRYAPGSVMPPLAYRRRNGLSAVFRAPTTFLGVGVVLVIAVYVADGPGPLQQRIPGRRRSDRRRHG